VTRRRLRLGAIAALVLAVVLFLTTVTALQWIALVLVLASIGVSTWTLFNPGRREV
jgi:drug/metabolite transporter (DMT)-like permease